MRSSVLAFIIFAASQSAHAENSIDTCIRAWKTSPFKIGASPDKTLANGVKVLGIGNSPGNDHEVTKTPQLVLVKPSVNVLGKSRMTLGNPNGWYCFDSNVSVLGKIQIDAHCKSHLASGKDGANVMGASDTNQGVTVLGSLRVTRFDCSGQKSESAESPPNESTN